MRTSVVFNVMGRDYEAAAMTTAFCGFGGGRLPLNAMVNMREHSLSGATVQL